MAGTERKDALNGEADMEMSRSKAVLRVVFLAVAMLGQLVSAARAQDEIRLQGSAEVTSGRVLLRDIAELKGAAAEGLGDAVVLDAWPADAAATGWTTLDVATVKAAIGRMPNVNWGRISLNGSSCTVRRKGDGKPAATTAAGTGPAAAAERVSDGTRVRDAVPARIASVLGVAIGSVRVTFDEGQATLLDTVTTGRSVEILHGGLAERMPITVRVYEKDRIVASGPIKVGVTVKRDCLIAKAGLKKGDVVTLTEAGIESRWLGAGLATAAVDDFGSAVKAGAVKAGQMLMKTDLEPAVVVKKGDLVSVSCVSGSIILKTYARASQDGRMDEVIKFETTESKKKRTFTARIQGPGRAVTAAAGSEAEAAETGTGEPGKTDGHLEP